MSTTPTPAFSFSKRFLAPVSECADLPQKLLDVAEEHVSEERDVHAGGQLELKWETLERLLAIEERKSKDKAEVKKAYLNDEAVNRFLQMVCAQMNSEQRTRAVSHPNTIDLTDHNIRYITLYSSEWPSTYKKMMVEKTISAAEYKDRVWRVLRRQDIKNPDDFRLLDTIFLPTCFKDHWTLGLLRPSTRKYGLLNSLSANENRTAAERRRASFSHFVPQYLAAIFGMGFDMAKEGWKEMEKPESGEQQNGADCGAYVCMNAVAVARDKGPYLVRMDKMAAMREGIASALAHGRFEEGLLEL